MKVMIDGVPYVPARQVGEADERNEQTITTLSNRIKILDRERDEFRRQAIEHLEKVESLTRDNEALLHRCGELNDRLQTAMSMAQYSSTENPQSQAIEGFAGMLQRQIDEIKEELIRLDAQSANMRSDLTYISGVVTALKHGS
jgi:uncharacterized coiled-coil DUF342 family protein